MGIEIRDFHVNDSQAVETLFITVNRVLATPDTSDRFETYIERSLIEEIRQIHTYYMEKGGQFWVAYSGNSLVGMAGVERHSTDTVELRRMYVSPTSRRLGVARKLLLHAEAWCRQSNVETLILSTSELQSAALQLYESSGFTLTSEQVVETASNKTIGGGIRRWSYSKKLR
jgi:putative acetyltransferase